MNTTDDRPSDSPSAQTDSKNAKVRLALHDMNGPIGTLKLDLYSARLAIEQVADAARGGDLSLAVRASQELISIVDNLDCVPDQLEKIAERLTKLVIEEQS